jgi:hypothetical protein
MGSYGVERIEAGRKMFGHSSSRCRGRWMQRLRQRSNQFKSVEDVQQAVSVQLTTILSSTPLEAAVSTGQLRLVQLLLDAGAGRERLRALSCVELPRREIRPWYGCSWTPGSM